MTLADHRQLADADARRIAAAWLARPQPVWTVGHAVGIRRFAETGAIVQWAGWGGTAHDVIGILDAATLAETPDLCALLIYVRTHGPRPAVPGWGDPPVSDRRPPG